MTAKAVVVNARITTNAVVDMGDAATGNEAVLAASDSVTLTGFDSSYTLNSGSTPPVTDIAAYNVTMTAGAATIDLTALTGLNGGTQSASGKKPQWIVMENLAALAQDPITIIPGASNGHEFLGSASKIVLKTGQKFAFFGNDGQEDVDGTHKTWDISGTLSQVLRVVVAYG